MARRTSPDSIVIVCLLPWLATLARGAVPGSSEPDGGPRYAHDPALTAHSPLHGNITKPQTRWSYSAGGRELLVWEWQGPATLSLPAIVDLDGDGVAQIIVQAADGTVHCVGSGP
jgi:hypothetical protein